MGPILTLIQSQLSLEGATKEITLTQQQWLSKLFPLRWLASDQGK